MRFEHEVVNTIDSDEIWIGHPPLLFPPHSIYPFEPLCCDVVLYATKCAKVDHLLIHYLRHLVFALLTMEEDHPLSLAFEENLRCVLPLALHLPHNRVVNDDMIGKLELAILVALPELHARPVKLVLLDPVFLESLRRILLSHLLLSSCMKFDRHKLRAFLPWRRNDLKVFAHLEWVAPYVGLHRLTEHVLGYLLASRISQRLIDHTLVLLTITEVTGVGGWFRSLAG
jgi:hypothetical protein